MKRYFLFLVILFSSVIRTAYSKSVAYIDDNNFCTLENGRVSCSFKDTDYENFENPYFLENIERLYEEKSHLGKMICARQKNFDFRSFCWNHLGKSFVLSNSRSRGDGNYSDEYVSVECYSLKREVMCAGGQFVPTGFRGVNRPERYSNIPFLFEKIRKTSSLYIHRVHITDDHGRERDPDFCIVGIPKNDIDQAPASECYKYDYGNKEYDLHSKKSGITYFQSYSLYNRPVALSYETSIYHFKKFLYKHDAALFDLIAGQTRSIIFKDFEKNIMEKFQEGVKKVLSIPIDQDSTFLHRYSRLSPTEKKENKIFAMSVLIGAIKTGLPLLNEIERRESVELLKFLGGYDYATLSSVDLENIVPRLIAYIKTCINHPYLKTRIEMLEYIIRHFSSEGAIL